MRLQKFRSDSETNRIIYSQRKGKDKEKRWNQNMFTKLFDDKKE